MPLSYAGQLEGYTSEDVDVLIQFINRRGYRNVSASIRVLELSQAVDRDDAVKMRFWIEHRVTLGDVRMSPYERYQLGLGRLSIEEIRS